LLSSHFCYDQILPWKRIYFKKAILRKENVGERGTQYRSRIKISMYNRLMR
jgi:hypothetical protein